MSLKEPHLKMSKSHADPRSRIQLNDQPEEIAAKVRLALTDSVTGVSYDPTTRPGVSNLLDIMSYLDVQGRAPVQLAQSYSSLSMRAFKEEVTASITGALVGIRARYNRFIEEDNAYYLEDVAKEGARKARERAKSTMANVRKSVGLG